MNHVFETRDLTLNTLVLHPDNVRAGSGAGYGPEQIAPLAANIAECGLLQPLLVAPLPGKDDGKALWGVLAGGRRLAALNSLADDKSAKGFSKTMKVACRVVPETQAAQVTLSFSENAMQLPMDAMDRFEAFVAMRERDGADVATIARRFAITERAVKESLRLGNIHPDIRQAHRVGTLSLEALKAFDAHPDPAVQLEAYRALSEQGGRVQDWHVRGYFNGRYVRAGDALGKVVYAHYKAVGGEIIADLIEEDSVLSDRPLIDKLLADVLSDAAEARRATLGLAWADHLTKPDWELTSAYGRVYRKPVELAGEALAQSDALAQRMAEIEDAFDEEGCLETQDALHAEYDAISEALETLSTGYTEMDAAIGGVLAVWTGRGIEFYDGMVRPEDMPARPGRDRLDGGPVDGVDQTTTKGLWSEKLKTDMAHIRTRSIGLALAQSPEIARDYADYTLVRSMLKPYSSHGTGTTIKGETGSIGAGDPVGSLKAIEDAFATLADSLALEWLELEIAEGFAHFRSLEEEQRRGLLAFAVSQSLTPSLAGSRNSALRQSIEAEVLPNVRDVWTPDAAFFSRLTKPDLLAILSDDLAMPTQAEAQAKSKKSELVTYLDGLFAAPFATLTEEQRQKVLVWAPAPMQSVTSQGGEALDNDELPQEAGVAAG